MAAPAMNLPLRSSRQPREVAIDEFKQIYATHQPEPLPESVQMELDHILAAADREAEKLGA